MSQAPSMPFFVDAYLADTTNLTTEEHGAYLLLLMAMWRRGGAVPDDDRDNARVTRLGLRAWRTVKARLLPFLMIEEGQLTQKRLKKEWAYVKSKRAKNAHNGTLGGRPRLNENNEIEKANGSVSVSETETQTKANPIPYPIPIEDTSSLRSDVTAPPSVEIVSRETPMLLPEGLRRTPEAPAFIALPTNRKDENFIITEDHVADFLELYPAVDVAQSLRSMRGWLIANPTKRKTKTGMLRFVNAWLSKEQDKGAINGKNSGKPNKNDNFLLGIHAAVAESFQGRAAEGGADRDDDRQAGLALLPP